MTLDDLAPPRPGAPPRALLFGGSGQIGERVLHNLLRAGWQVVATSRRPRAVVAGVEWRVADLLQPWAAREAFDAIFSCGPLDHFATWYQASAVQAPRVVAFGSTSGQVKQESGDAAERDLSRRLREAEATVLQAAAARNAAATVLRPTLVYGAGRDRTLTEIASLARRAGVFVLPRSACGLRQPVHVQDLADAALAVLAAPATAGRSYDLGGGEVLDYTAMVRRVLASVAPRPRLLRVPHAAFVLALALAHRAGRLRGMGSGALQRMAEDLVFDLEPARRDFGYAPRAFVITPAMVSAPATTSAQ
jgi:uncharacterized protein YbjT (DUF2867 family)